MWEEPANLLRQCFYFNKPSLHEVPVLSQIPQFKIISIIFYQCCGAGAVGAEIIFGPGAGIENKF